MYIGFLIVVASPVELYAQALRAPSSTGPGSCYILALTSCALGLSCSETCGIFPDWGLNPLSLALGGRFLSTESPGKSSPFFFDGFSD